MNYFIVLAALFMFNVCNADTQCPVVSKTSPTDRRKDTSVVRLVQYNVEWFFIDYYANADCPGNNCSWHNATEANTHLTYVANVVKELNPDIMNLCEVEGCDELGMLIKNVSPDYNPYLIKGADTSTGQNAGMITKIDPIRDLYRTEERVNYPIPNSKCGYTGAPGNSGVSKHYITEFSINDMDIVMIGAHLLAYPTDTERCAQREAQAQVLQNVIIGYHKKNYDIIVLGDFNDFDGEVLDSNNNKPISQVLDILKGNMGMYAGEYELSNSAEKMPQSERYSDWWDKNGDCKSVPTEFSKIDHILVTPRIQDKIVGQFIYTGYAEFCGTYNSDHYPVVIDIKI